LGPLTWSCEIATPHSLSPLCRNCAVVFYRDGTYGAKAFRVGREVIGRKVRITAHHLRTLPTAQLLQREQRRAVLYVPRRPAVPKIVSAEIPDAGALSAWYQALVLSCLIGLPRKLNTH